MKKIMIALCVLFTAIAVNAATLLWSGTTASLAPGTTDYSGMVGYVIDGSVSGFDATTFLAALAAGTMSIDDAVAANAALANESSTFVNRQYNGVVYWKGQSTIENGTYNPYVVVVDNGYFWATDPLDGGLIVAVSGNINKSFTNTSTTSWVKIGDDASGGVPEPTSGLLLLVGGALLALRRKQK